ncbi:RluA family pseudouridine synthase [Streptomyces zagrosensis]|uniref:RNA pseudouridylate synthase n=1 Tax=Streptomyces zagrosensis TaxID=1042984 RepID=A0A7W9UWA9_9ACTN|nr:RNA pseudouridine synthase [Streptomyces zagrosensis]MBB5933347.1 tRNA pseudouridine32 synthase/23S rRNA pseudouridine746 synthase/23S rRNA pseudouridine1911/1915/1917 synthase [Streptomyces zagrosensis]
MNEWTQIRDRAGSIVREDAAFLVLNKPAGISVMGERHESDLVRMADEVGETLIPCHRIDKVTSGAVLFAKEQRIQSEVTRQFNKRTVDKTYLALVPTAGLPGGLPLRGTIDMPLSVGRKNRVRVGAQREDIAASVPQGPAGPAGPDTAHGSWRVPQEKVFTHVKTYPSITHFTRLWSDDRHTLLVIEPITGRRHQIRVHLAWIGFPIVGDPLFDKQAAARGERTGLHSWRLSFDATWAGNERITVSAEPSDDFWAPVADRLPAGGPAAVLGGWAATGPSAA